MGPLTGGGERGDIWFDLTLRRNRGLQVEPGGSQKSGDPVGQNWGALARPRGLKNIQSHQVLDHVA